ncbi:MAG TPA: hypothetical protein VG324_04180 [Blastocatellia bacterium]|nr:hypothetical protein [Blastocatellia bacterium]
MGRRIWDRIPFPRLRIDDPKREIDRAGRVVDPRIDRLDLGLETLARGPGVVILMMTKKRCAWLIVPLSA